LDGEKKKVDMEDKAESTNYNLAPSDKKLEMLVNFLSNLVTIGVKFWIFGLDAPSGKPK
jgi:hypothetical protein